MPNSYESEIKISDQISIYQIIWLADLKEKYTVIYKLFSFYQTQSPVKIYLVK